MEITTRAYKNNTQNEWANSTKDAEVLKNRVGPELFNFLREILHSQFLNKCEFNITRKGSMRGNFRKTLFQTQCLLLWVLEITQTVSLSMDRSTNRVLKLKRLLYYVSCIQFVDQS
ncbi:hypothetical protein B1J93_00315 [Leptospira kirschneri serovar Pomona]|uniref:Uncharacterized protein n=1 Tax=Leptospira kirschneri serovar Pomona TaxID=561005 RepID=A0A1T1E4Y4_9LEPT|nr:hypothetical protein APS47_16465 [Leptospira kirschneri serovar Mozdok]OOV48144.1 hypothetical protein B1J93_00315 [Leptospira kirschneri serovar Pomona]OOV48828.1 hypothetical protein B1J94_09675 [Leptospira kirschneri serovar Grippotyphosa]